MFRSGKFSTRGNIMSISNHLAKHVGRLILSQRRTSLVVLSSTQEGKGIRPLLKAAASWESRIKADNVKDETSRFGFGVCI